MLEKVKGISIKGRCFTSETQFSFYPESNDRIAIIYGKNGSGKSTLSEGFSFISSGNSSTDISATLLDRSDAPVSLAEESKIFVFNEKYIDENVKINDDGLGTIILLGGQVDLQSDIDRYTELEKSAKSDLEKAQGDLDQFDQVSSPISPGYHLQRIRNILKSGWASTDAAIKGNKTNSKVTDAVVKEICELAVSDTVAQLQSQFDEKKSLLKKVSDPTTSYPTPISKIDVAPDFEHILCNLLAQTVEKPELTGREKLILDAIQSGRQSFVESAQKDFRNASTSFCPYCYRPLDEEYKQGLIESINRVLNKDVETHRSELQAVLFPKIKEDYAVFSELDPKLVDLIMTQRNVCVNLIDRYKTFVAEKENNIYTPLHISPLGLESNLEALNVLLMQLEVKRQEFTDAIRKRKNLIDTLIILNKKIAHLQVGQTYRDYQKQLHARKTAESDLDTKQDQYNQIVNHLKNLRQQKARIGLAVNSINNSLDYVFFARGRLSIELKNEKYYLKSNGKDVKPKDVSLGERNIVALCYFFTEILSNQDVTKLYQDEELVIIDDPVSSFDFENKVGIISFIRYQINRIIKGNAHSKVLIFSHDLATVFDLNKAMDEICQSTKGIAKNKSTTFYPAELYNSNLRRFTKRRSEYGELLGIIYHYAANGENADNKIAIGNMMRRALEAFSTFTYRKSIEDVLCTPSVLEILGNRSVYFENLMCRLVLHGESHFEEQVYNLHDDANFYEFISDSEKQRTAKDILCFMYLLNNHHVEAYLRDISGAIKKVETWSKGIPTNTDFDIKRDDSKKVIRLYNLPLSAGQGNEMFDESFVEYEIDEIDCDFALRISGDSMEPEFPNGSIVLIKKCDTLDEGKVGAFYLNGAVYCKRLLRERGKVFLQSSNPQYEPIEVHEQDRLVVYGQVIKVMQDLPDAMVIGKI